MIVLLSAFGAVALMVRVVGARVAFNLLSGAAKTQVLQSPGGNSGGQSTRTSVGQTTQQTTSGQDGTDLAVRDTAGISGPAASATGVEPSSVTASTTSSLAPDASGNSVSYDAGNVVDGDPQTSWNVDGNGIGQSITLDYSDPRYDKIDSSDGTDRFYQLYAVKRAKIEFSDGSNVEAGFQRDPGMQYTNVPDTRTNYVRIAIEDPYPPGNAPDGETYPYTLDKAAIFEVAVEGS